VQIFLLVLLLAGMIATASIVMDARSP